jgi:hypothetical protein
MTRPPIIPFDISLNIALLKIMSIALKVPIEQEAYWQTYPFGGPNRSYNICMLDNLRMNLNIFLESDSHPSYEQQLNHVQLKDYQALPRSTPSLPDHLEESFFWKTSWLQTVFSGHHIENVLCIGVGHGDELLIMKELFPLARLKAIDWNATCGSNILDATNCEYSIGNVFDLLANMHEKYNVIFCHHFFEHLYRPERFLSLVTNALSDDGFFVAGLPLLLEARPYAECLDNMTSRPCRIRLLDLSLLDIGHPLKLSFGGLNKLLLSNGLLCDVNSAICPEMIARNTKISLSQLEQSQKVLIHKRNLFVSPLLGVISNMIEVMMRSDFPGWSLALRSWLSFERRFLGRLSGGYIANLSVDAIVVAKQSSKALKSCLASNHHK